jgi:hypothetical protein
MTKQEREMEIPVSAFKIKQEDVWTKRIKKKKIQVR